MKPFYSHIFDLNQICKMVLTQRIKFGALTQLNCFIFSYKIGLMLWSYRKCQEFEIWRRLGRVRIKNVLTQTIQDNIFGTKYRTSVILDWKRKVWYLFFRDFWLLLPKSDFLKRDWALDIVSTQIWGIFDIY